MNTKTLIIEEEMKGTTSIFIFPNSFESYYDEEAFSALNKFYRVRRVKKVKKSKKNISIRDAVIIILKDGKKYKISEISNIILNKKMCENLNGKEQTARKIISSNVNRLAREYRIKKKRSNGFFKYYL